MGRDEMRGHGAGTHHQQGRGVAPGEKAGGQRRIGRRLAQRQRGAIDAEQRQAIGAVEQQIEALDRGDPPGLIAGKDADQLDALMAAILPGRQDQPVVAPAVGQRLADQRALDLVDPTPEQLAQGLHEARIVEQAVGFIGGDDLHGVLSIQGAIDGGRARELRR